MLTNKKYFCVNFGTAKFDFLMSHIPRVDIHTYNRSRFIPEGVAEASQIFLRDAQD
jgi:hypothetical protein